MKVSKHVEKLLREGRNTKELVELGLQGIECLVIGAAVKEPLERESADDSY